MASGILVLVFDSQFSYFVSAVSVALWTAFYLNPITDPSNKNFTYFLQAAVCVAGLLFISSSKK
jgi:hypothetical protein